MNNATKAEEPAGSAKLKVAVVDLSKVVADYTRKGDEENALKARIETINKQIEDLRNMIKGIESTIREKEGIIAPDSEEMNRLQLERSVKKLQMEHMIESAKGILNRGKANILAVIYEDFRVASAAYAKRFGYDLVMAKNIPDVANRDYENLMLQISMQPVYYYQPEMDITEFIIADMNKAYEEARKAKIENGPAVPAN
jgi:Skp family chaperone for outer membrane proteins